MAGKVAVASCKAFRLAGKVSFPDLENVASEREEEIKYKPAGHIMVPGPWGMERDQGTEGKGLKPVP